MGHHALVHHLSARKLIGGTTSAVVVSSDAMRFGGFDRSLLEHPRGIGDLSGEVTRGCALPGPLPCTPLCLPKRAPGFRLALSTGYVVPTAGWAFGAYSRAKLAGVFLAWQLEARGVVGRASSVMPGVVNTDIQRRDRSAGAAAAGLARLSSLALPGSVTEARAAWRQAEPWLSEAVATHVLPWFLRDAAAAARVILAAAVQDTRDDSAAARAGLHYFGGTGQPLGEASLSLVSLEWAEAVAQRLWEVAEAARQADEARSTAEGTQAPREAQPQAAQAA